MPKRTLNLDLMRRRIYELYGTQSAFAARRGWSRQYVSRLLAGKAAVSAERAAEIAGALGVSVDAVAPFAPNGSGPTRVREQAAAYVVEDTGDADSVEWPETYTYIDPVDGLLTRVAVHPVTDVEERRARLRAMQLPPRATGSVVEDFLREKHEEIEREEREFDLRHGRKRNPGSRVP